MLFDTSLFQGDSYVRARTETVKTPVQTQEDFRPRCGQGSKSNQSAISSLFQEWNVHKDRAADDHQDDQDNNPAVAAGRLGSTLMARSSICTIINTFIFVITYPNLTKMKRHVWYWYFRVPVSFPNLKCLRSPH